MLETEVVARALYSTLSGDATLASAAPGGVRDGIAPAGTAYPFVQFQYQGGGYVMQVASYHILHDGIWMVAALTKGNSYTPLGVAAERIKALLHRQSVTHAGGVMLYAEMQDVIRTAFVEASVEYRRLGGTFRIGAQSS